MRDIYGIPDNMFGIFPPELPALIGRVVMVSALLEQKLLGLADALGVTEAGTHDGLPASQLVASCRADLRAFPSELKGVGTELLDTTRECLRERNAIVHSLWPDSEPDRYWGWRSAKAAQLTAGQSVAEVTTDTGEMTALIGRLVELVSAMDSFRNQTVGRRNN